LLLLGEDFVILSFVLLHFVCGVSLCDGSVCSLLRGCLEAFFLGVFLCLEDSCVHVLLCGFLVCVCVCVCVCV